MGEILPEDVLGVTIEESWYETTMLVKNIVLPIRQFLGYKVDNIPPLKEGTIFIVPDRIRQIYNDRKDFMSFIDGKIEYGEWVYSGIPLFNS